MYYPNKYCSFLIFPQDYNSTMEAISDTIPSHTTTLAGSHPFYSSQTSSNVHVLLPLSPLSFPPSPTSLSPTTIESTQSSPLSNSSSHCSDEPNAHCRSSTSTSDQDDLTCLSWLHQRGNNLLPLQPLPKINLLPKEPETPQAFTSVESLSPSSNKPPYSFSSLIFMAIEDSPNKLLPVKGIYEWIVNSFPYYRTAAGGWRNSVRHNLSLSKSFRRIQRDKSQVVPDCQHVKPSFKLTLSDSLSDLQKAALGLYSNRCHLSVYCGSVTQQFLWFPPFSYNANKTSVVCSSQ